MRAIFILLYLFPLLLIWAYTIFYYKPDSEQAKEENKTYGEYVNTVVKIFGISFVPLINLVFIILVLRDHPTIKEWMDNEL